MSRLSCWFALSLAFLGLLAGRAEADVNVYVGYADGLRPSPFFPTPWAGDAKVQHFAGQVTNDIDAGAILVQNTGSTAITISDLLVDGFGDGASFHIWGGFIGSGMILDPNRYAIFTQTTQYDFDSSDDEGSNPLAIPAVHLTIGGVTTTLMDTAQVLNTEGTDHLAQAGLNESHQWRLIGTTGGQGGGGIVPEPSSLALCGIAALLYSGYAWRRRKALMASPEPAREAG